METKAESTAYQTQRVDIPEFMITQGMIEDFREGTHDPFIALHTGERAIALGFQLEFMADLEVRKRMKLAGRYQFQETEFLGVVRAGVAIHGGIERRVSSRNGREEVNVIFYGRDEKKCMQTNIIYATDIEDRISQEREGVECKLTLGDLEKVQLGIGDKAGWNTYPLALGRASEMLVQHAIREGIIKEGMMLQQPPRGIKLPAYTHHRIEVYSAMHELRSGDRIKIEPENGEQNERGALKTAARARTVTGRDLYTLHASLRFIPRGLLQR